MMRIKLSKTQTARVKSLPVHRSGFYNIREENLHILGLAVIVTEYFFRRLSQFLAVQSPVREYNVLSLCFVFSYVLMEHFIAPPCHLDCCQTHVRHVLVLSEQQVSRYTRVFRVDSDVSYVLFVAMTFKPRIYLSVRPQVIDQTVELRTLLCIL